MKDRGIFKWMFLLSVLMAFYFFVSCSQKKTKLNVNEINDTTTHVYSTVEEYITSKNTQSRLANAGQFKLTDLLDPDEKFSTIMIDPTKTFQTIIGFGGAVTDASAETFYKLNKNLQDEILKAYYDPDSGIGYTLCRTHINSCDFSSESYAYDSVKNDTS
jgi:glucosylceramidase